MEKSVADEAEEFFASARSNYIAGSFDLAENNCCKGVHRAPNSADGWQLLGMIYEGKGNVQDAILAYRKALGYKFNGDVQASLSRIAQTEFTKLSESVLICSAILQTWAEQHHNYTVPSGPFKGMKIHPDTLLTSKLGNGALPKVLGIYGSEIESWILGLRSYKTIIVMNAEEGYFAIGLKRLHPDAAVYAIDPSASNQRACRANAAINGVAIIVSNTNPVISAPEDTFLFLDVEGGEEALYIEGDAIIEIHDWVDRSLADRLLNKYRLTHRIELISSSDRDPSKIEFLNGFPDHIRWLSVQEQKPEVTMWYKLIKE
jgi:hypothetical protein